MKKLNRWYAEIDYDNSFVAVHYIGGEDYILSDDHYFDTLEEAEDRVKALNEAEITLEWNTIEGNCTYKVNDPNNVLYGGDLGFDN